MITRSSTYRNFHRDLILNSPVMAWIIIIKKEGIKDWAIMNSLLYVKFIAEFIANSNLART